MKRTADQREMVVDQGLRQDCVRVDSSFYHGEVQAVFQDPFFDDIGTVDLQKGHGSAEALHVIPDTLRKKAGTDTDAGADSDRDICISFRQILIHLTVEGDDMGSVLKEPVRVRRSADAAAVFSKQLDMVTVFYRADGRAYSRLAHVQPARGFADALFAVDHDKYLKNSG